MARKTKKVGAAGRFGPRYGVPLRYRWEKVYSEKKKRHTCPKCHYHSLVRESTGVWICKHCGFKVAGAAYTPDVYGEWTGVR